MNRDFDAVRRFILSRRSVVQGLASIPLVATLGGCAATVRAPSQDPIARNLAIAKKLYDGYHLAPQGGELRGVFDPADFAEGWTYFCPAEGGESTPATSAMAARANADFQRIRKRLPDYKMDDFSAWPTDFGCAWLWRANGHTSEGTLMEGWQALFIWTNAAGKVTRLEIFDDWHGFPQMMAYAWDVSLDEVTKTKDYGNSPWTPTPSSNYKGAPPAPPARPASARAANNLRIARGFYDAFHESVKLGYVPAPTNVDDWAADSIIFSAWSGTNKGKFLAYNNPRPNYMWDTMPDYKMDHFAAWPNDDGCIWRWLVNGHDKDGRYHEFWEQVGFRTNAEGKIARFEFYDGIGMAQTLGLNFKLPLEDVWDIRKFMAAMAKRG
ncbi:MAG: hypothetical protein ABW034_05165 [Steroidobacteraceae bacterium]